MASHAAGSGRRSHREPDDERLTEQIDERLAAYEPLRASGARLTVGVENGVVHVRGHDRSATQPAEIARLVTAIDGVRGVRLDQLRNDEQLAVDVAAALAQDPQVARSVIRVHAALGVITLRGTATEAAVLERAIALCTAAPGVVRVRSEILVHAAAAASRA